MNNFSKILWGIVLVALGVVIGLNALDIVHINFFFRGWWTLLIIIPCLIDLFNTKGDGKTGDLVRNSNWSMFITWNKRNNQYGNNFQANCSSNICYNRAFNDI